MARLGLVWDKLDEEDVTALLFPESGKSSRHITNVTIKLTLHIIKLQEGVF